jgi:hypothetical protein
MRTKTNVFVGLGAALFTLWGLFHLAIGVYHTILFATQGSMSLFTVAYRIPLVPADLTDPARQLGSDAIEVYSILLGGYGIVAILAAVMSVRRQRIGLWLNTIGPGIASAAYVYGLIIPGRLTGANAWTGPIIYLVGVACLWIGFSRLPQPAQAGHTTAHAIIPLNKDAVQR